VAGGFFRDPLGGMAGEEDASEIGVGGRRKDTKLLCRRCRDSDVERMTGWSLGASQCGRYQDENGSGSVASWMKRRVRRGTDVVDKRVGGWRKEKRIGGKKGKERIKPRCRSLGIDST
jgi:hypothetical protein